MENRGVFQTQSQLRTWFWSALILAAFGGVGAVRVGAEDSRSAATPIIVAILDTPVDYSHPVLAPLQDRELMEALTFTTDQGNTYSWSTLNEAMLEHYRKNTDPNLLPAQLSYRNAVTALSSGKIRLFRSPFKELAQAYRAYWAGYWQELTSKSWRKSMEVLRGYLHGTHVAGIAAAGLGGVKLINFPFIEIKNGKRFSPRHYDPEEDRASTRSHFAQLTRSLQQAKARVVNLSIASSNDILRDLLNRYSRIWKKLKDRKLKARLIATRVRIYCEEMARFFLDNPQTIFVLAAGNADTDLERYAMKGKNHTALIQAPNLIKVASVRENGKLSRFSNYAPNHVAIAAPGEGALSAQTGGGWLHMSGTSMATPMVTRRLAEILVAQPDLTPEQAIEILFSEAHSVSQPGLDTQVQQARILRNAFDCAQLLQPKKAG